MRGRRNRRKIEREGTKGVSFPKKPYYTMYYIYIHRRVSGKKKYEKQTKPVVKKKKNLT